MDKSIRLKNILLFFLFLLLSTATALAQCVIPVTEEQPFIEEFDGEVFECWSVESNGGNWNTVVGSTGAVIAFSYSNNGDEARLVSPFLDLSGASSATFSFAYAMMGLYTNDELIVSYRSSEADPWHDLGSYSINDYQNYYEESFELQDLSATYQISFLGRGLGGYMIFVDKVEVVAAGGCARPVNLQATEIRAFSAWLDWSETGNEERWALDFDGHTMDVGSKPYLMEGLDPWTTYTFRVKAQCSGGQESEWSNSISFTTLCDVITVTDDAPFYDDFEASEDFVCWQNEILIGTDNWVVDPGYTILNNTAFFIWLGGETLLISPPLDLTGVTHPTLTFKHKQLVGLNYGTVDELVVGYRTDESDNWHTLDYFNTATEGWEEVSIALPDPSATYQIVFDGIGNDAEGVYVDDVFVGNDNTAALTESAVVKASVSPNPTQGRAVVVANFMEGEVTVFDLFGKMITTVLVREGQAEIDLGGLAQGVYMARVKSDEGFSTTLRLVRE